MNALSSFTSPSPRSWAWPAAIGAATVLGTLAFACMMPFAALAVLAAATMRPRQAFATIAAIWATNQVLGFAVLGYPQTGYAIGWGLALGVGALFAAVVAQSVLRPGARMVAVPMAVAFMAAFAGYELLLFGFALIAGGTETFAPAIVLRIFTNDAMWFVSLAALHQLLTRTAPGLFGPAPALRFA